MNKSILTIVLASLALPAMALLNPTQQAKLDNAWSVLTANGVNPTVMENKLNAAWDSNHWNNGANFGNAFTTAVARQGKENFFNVDNFTVTSGSVTVKAYFVGWGGDLHYFGNSIDGTPNGSTVSTDSSEWKTRTEDLYSLMTHPSSNYGYGSSLGINRLDSRIKNADIGGEVGEAIQDKARGLKATIRNIGKLEVAAELAKSVQGTCVDDKTTNACTGLSVKFAEIGSSIETVGTAEYFTTPSGLVNAPKEIWYEDPNNPSAFINATSGMTASRTNLLLGFNSATHHAEVSAVDLYENSLNDINDIAGAYIDITGSENFLFGDLTDLNGNTSSSVSNSTLSGLGI